VSGHAYDLAGRPLAGATIVGVSKANDYRSVRTNNEGFYELAALPDGDYKITIQSYESDEPINVLVKLVQAKNSAQDARVVDGDDLTVDLRLAEKR
jgi:hypothetical protein